MTTSSATGRQPVDAKLLSENSFDSVLVTNARKAGKIIYGGPAGEGRLGHQGLGGDPA